MTSKRKKKKQKCPKRQAIGKRSRAKGHDFERWVARYLKPAFPNARRHLEYQDAEAYGVDLVNTSHYDIQCKRGKKYAPVTAINEIKSFGTRVLITKADNGPALAVIELDEFLRLIQLAQKGGL